MKNPQSDGSDAPVSVEAEKVIDDAVLSQVMQDVGEGQGAAVLLLFAGELERRIEELRDAASRSDVDVLRRVAHGAKGSASTFGAPRVAAAARRLEEACKSAAPAAEIASLAQRLIEHLQPAATEVRSRLRVLEEADHV